MILRALAGRRPRIALLRGTPGLGDLLCAVPSWRALRSAVPDAHVTLVGARSSAWAPERYPAYVDEHLAFPGYPGLPDQPEDPAATLAFLAEAQARRFDLVIQQHGSGVVTNPLARMLGGARTGSFHLPGQYVPDPELSIPYPAGEHEVRRHLLLLAALGAPPQGEELEFPVREADRDALRRAVPALADGSPYVVLHPGANDPARCWPASSFAGAGDALAAAGFRVVLTGVAGERALLAEVRAAMTAPALDLAGRTPLGSLAALLAGAQGEELEFPVREADRDALRRAVPALADGSPYVVLHPGANDPARCWPASSFAGAGDALAAAGFRVVLTGVAGERALLAEVRAAMTAPALDLAGRTPLGSLAALLAGARLLVANDTGTTHLCCAVGTPSVVVLLAPSSATWVPLDAERHPGLWGDRDGAVSVERVLVEAHRLLAAAPAFTAWP